MLLLRDGRAELEAVGVSAFGISRDSPYSHVAWREALDLDLPLLSDWNAEAVRGFGVGREYRGLADVAERGHSRLLELRPPVTQEDQLVRSGARPVEEVEEEERQLALLPDVRELNRLARPEPDGRIGHALPDRDHAGTGSPV